MANYERLKTEYLCYLMNRVQVNAAGEDGYFMLCHALMEYPFLPILDMDDNRCYDCRMLRRDFADDYDEETGDILDGLYSEYGMFMELLVVLSEKMAYDLADSEYECAAGKWFKELLQNSGLIECTNDWYGRPGNGSSYVIDILDKINYRKYGWDGEGGLFPLQWAKTDQRYSELIIQMNNYIEENYDIS